MIKKILFAVLFVSSTIFSQLSLKVFTDKTNYEYGEQIIVYCKVTNLSDTTFEFLAPTYGSCQAEFLFNDFESSQFTACLATTELLKFEPYGSKLYSWIINPQDSGLPNVEGTQTIIGIYYFGLTDTIQIEAPKFIGGKLSVGYVDSNSTKVFDIKKSISTTVLDSSKFDNRISETWQITSQPIDDLISEYRDSSIFQYFERAYFSEYTSNNYINELELLPLQVGNKWYYKINGVSYDINPNPINDSLVISVIDDTLMNEHKYFKIFENNGHYIDKYWMRVDSLTGNIFYKYDNSEERLRYSLFHNTPEEIETDEGIYYLSNYANSLLWDSTRTTKHYILHSLFTQEMIFVEGIGIVYKYNTFDFGESYETLVGCKINGKTYGDSLLVGVKNNNENIPFSFQLSQNYPNPFNPTTTIRYTIPSKDIMLNSSQHLNNSEIPNQVRDDNQNVKLIIYDILGRKILTLVNRKQNPGKYKVSFDGSNLSSGVYYYQLKFDEFVQTKKMILLK